MGEGGREPLHIDLGGVGALGLQKELMALLVGKAHDLRLDGGAVAGARRRDGAVIEGRAVEIAQDEFVRFLVGVGKIARYLRLGHALIQKGEGEEEGIALLRGELFKVHRAAVEAGGGARLEAPHRIAEFHEALGEEGGGGEPVGAALLDDFSRDGARIEVDACRNDDGATGKDAAVVCDDARNFPVFREDARRFALHDAQIFRVLQNALHLAVVGVLVRLGAEGLHGRSLARVEHPDLQRAAVGIEAHLPAQSVYFAHQMPLRRAADGGVAGEKADAV